MMFADSSDESIHCSRTAYRRDMPANARLAGWGGDYGGTKRHRQEREDAGSTGACVHVEAKNAGPLAPVNSLVGLKLRLSGS